VVLTAGTLVNGLRLRHRLSGLTRLDAQPGQQDEDYLLVQAPGVEVDDVTRRAAAAHAQAEELDVLDLVPGNLPLPDALDLARAVDTVAFRSAGFAVGRGALHAVLVRRDVWDRMEASPEAGAPRVRDRADLVRLMVRLKQHAARATDFVVVPSLRAVDAGLPERLGVLQATYDAFAPVALAIPAARSSLVLAGLVLSPGWGAAAAATVVLQPYLVTGGSALAPHPRWSLRRDIVSRVLDPFTMIKAAAALNRHPSPSADADAEGDPIEAIDPIEALRPDYEAELAPGLARFFEPRRTTCPWCDSRAIAERVRTGDLAQFKPGEFVIEECASCGLLFQNPRLTIDGLNFYYRDFYDGLGAGGTQFLFAHSEPSYRGRVDLACRHSSPQAWLDVGSGYGHFCLVARGLLPATRFDGLDMGSSIEESWRRGWIDHAYRGLFPDLADELQDRYDTVSMHHYLEHTRDPRAELVAAHRVLRPGGHLLIEVPDPESRFAQLMGRFWVPWLQPQHQQFLPVANLCRALEAHGFSVVEIERGPAHQPVDLGGGLWMWAASLAPPPRLPWRDPPTPVERFRRGVILVALAPIALAGMAADRVIKPFVSTKAPSWSNTYRVLARKR
jgi:SAM-dependent methyltransferase